MNDRDQLLMLFEKPASRRFWLLLRALECLPLNRAINLAQMADDFIAGAHIERHSCHVPTEAEPPTASTAASGSSEFRPVTYGAGKPGEAMVPQQTRLPLSAAQREHLLDRLAMGAKNAVLAAEFGLSPGQVHGVRMGAAREIATRRQRFHDNKPHPTTRDIPTASASVDDIVRYLRQQDDIVVSQENGEFLVNARFRLSLAELVSRANRMRARQGKPEFDLSDGQPRLAENLKSTNEHQVTEPPSVLAE